MAFTALLAEGSRAASVVFALSEWALQPKPGSAVKVPAERRRELSPRQWDARLPEDPRDALAVLEMRFLFRQLQIDELCRSLIAASVRADQERTETRLRTKLMSSIFKPAVREPEASWRQLDGVTVNTAIDMVQSLDIGKKPLPPPQGFFGTLSRKLSGRTSLASPSFLKETEALVNELNALRSELRAVIEEMERN